MDKKLIGLMSVFFLFFFIFAFAVALPNTFFKLSQVTQAQVETVPSTESTRILAWPLYNIKANGKAVSTITVIVRNAKTKPIEGKIVTVTTTLGKIKESSLSSNKEGMSIFHLTSDTPGVANIEVTIDNNLKVVQNVSVQFIQ